MSIPETDTNPEFAISLFAQEDPNSLRNRAPLIVAEALARVPAEYFDLNDSGLQQACKAIDRDIAVRISFWAEYHEAVRDNRLMRVNMICEKVMAEYEFRRKLRTSPKWLAYICTEPPSLAALNEALVRNAYKRCQKLLAEPPQEVTIDETFDSEGRLLHRKTIHKPIAGVEKLATELRKEMAIPTKRVRERRKTVEPPEDEVEEIPQAPTLSPEAEMAAIEEMMKGKGNGH